MTPRRAISILVPLALLAAALSIGSRPARSEEAKTEPKKPPSSYAPVVPKEDFATTLKRMRADKPNVEKRHQGILASRYDLASHPAKGVKMFRGKPVQGGVRAKLGKGATWASLGNMTPEEIRDKDLFPTGFMPLPHPAAVGTVDPGNPVFDSRGMLATDVTVPVSVAGTGTRTVTINVLGRTTVN